MLGRKDADDETLLLLLSQTLVMEGRQRFDEWWGNTDMVDRTVSLLLEDWDVVYGEGDLMYWIQEKSKVKMKRGEAYDQFQMRLDRIFRGYGDAAGVSVTPYEKIAVLVNSLPTGELRNYATQRKDRIDDMRGNDWAEKDYLEFVRAMRNKAKNLTTKKEPKADIYSLNRAGDNPARSNKKNVRCYNCGKKGHYKTECRSRSKKIVCFHCNKLGNHLARDCPDKVSSQYAVSVHHLGLPRYNPMPSDKTIVTCDAIRITVGVNERIVKDAGVDTHAEIVCVQEENEEAWTGKPI